jgi:TPR repeat protein
VTQDLSKAVEWYKQAAAQGNAYGQYNLGYCYDNGYGVTQDLSKAVEWYKQAAAQGNASGQNDLGYCYQHGQGVTQDYSKAVELYKQAAAQGNAYGQSNLGYCYLNGLGVSRSAADAANWFKKAAPTQSASCIWLAVISLCLQQQQQQQEHGEGLQWLSRAVALQEGKSFVDRSEWKRDDGAVFAAASTLSKSSYGGDFLLGWCYEHGVGVQASVSKALESYESVLKALPDCALAKEAVERLSKVCSLSCSCRSPLVLLVLRFSLLICCVFCSRLFLPLLLCPGLCRWTAATAFTSRFALSHLCGVAARATLPRLALPLTVSLFCLWRLSCLVCLLFSVLRSRVRAELPACAGVVARVRASGGGQRRRQAGVARAVRQQARSHHAG